MLQAINELKEAKWRTSLITITITLITLMVTFLSALTQGLSFESVSALKTVTGDNSIVITEGSSTLSSSNFDDYQIKELESMDAKPLYLGRERYDDGVKTLLNWPYNINLPDKELYLDHQPVEWKSAEEILEKRGRLSAFILNKDDNEKASQIENIKILNGEDRWNTSAAYAGEQLSLNMMIMMLYVVSILVVGAFFVVWTLQRLHSIAVFSALGASRRVLLLQSFTQAFLVTITGVFIGSVGTIFLVKAIGENLPAVLSLETIVFPSVFLSIAAFIGALLSLVPVLRVDPREALERA